MTAREFEIIRIIKENPFVSQQEIAERLQITRSSVAVHIANLSRKGIIKGRGYVLEEKQYVSVIGGANVDIVGTPWNALRSKDSNPGQVQVSLGGVGRNIAENIARLGIHTKLFTVVGQDMHGDKIISESQQAGIDMTHVKRVREAGTGTYLAILNEGMDMEVAIAGMDILQHLDSAYLEDNQRVIDGSDIVLLDTNLEEAVLHEAVERFRKNRLFLDTVSHTKALRASKVLGAFHTLKPNRLEAEALTGIEIRSESDLLRVAGYLHQEGVEKLFITLGEEGVFYSGPSGSGRLKAKGRTPKNATGAGDAFQAGLVYAELLGWSMEKAAGFAICASLLAMDSEDTINTNMSVENVIALQKYLEG